MVCNISIFLSSTFRLMPQERVEGLDEDKPWLLMVDKGVNISLYKCYRGAFPP